LRLARTHEFSYFCSREFTADHILKGLSRRRPRVQVPSTPLKSLAFSANSIASGVTRLEAVKQAPEILLDFLAPIRCVNTLQVVELADA
jgi:hypothetical protein